MKTFIPIKIQISAITLLMILFTAPRVAVSQDIIFKRTGEEIKAKVKQVGVSEVTYSRYDNLEGPSYLIPKAELSRIRYENGTEELFNTTAAVTQPSTRQEPLSPQADTSKPEKFKPFPFVGFNGLIHNGIYGGTVPARPDGGDFHPSGGDSYTGYGFGVNIDYRFMEYLSVHFDINYYASSTPVSYNGGYATSDWVWEMNDYGSRLVGPFTGDANYNITTTGMRLGLKVYPLNKPKYQPWAGIYYGYYTVTLGVYSGDKTKTYGYTSEDVTGLTFMNIGVDFWDKNKSFGASIFAEFGSPVVRNYSIENCLVNGWTFQDYGEGMHIFGYTRIGLSLNFFAGKRAK